MIRIDSPVVLAIRCTGSLLLLSLESVPLGDSDRDRTVGACVRANSNTEADNCKTTQWTCRGAEIERGIAPDRAPAGGQIVESSTKS